VLPFISELKAYALVLFPRSFTQFRRLKQSEKNATQPRRQLYDAAAAHAPFMIADRTSGEIFISPGADKAHEILFDIEAAKVHSIGWRFDVMEGSAVKFSMRVISRSSRRGEPGGSSRNTASPAIAATVTEFLSSGINMTEAEAGPQMGPTEFTVRDNLKCVQDAGVFDIPEKHAKLIVVLTWSVSAPSPSYFAALTCSNRAARKSFLRYNIEIKKRAGQDDEGRLPPSDRTLLTGTASGLTDAEMYSIMFGHGDDNSENFDEAYDPFRLDPEDMDEQGMMSDLSDAVSPFDLYFTAV
jgi:hypothetical protein